MIPLILILAVLQSPPTKSAPIEPKAPTEMDRKRLSQYPHLGGGLYNIDAVPPEDPSEPPVPPAARDPFYRQKKTMANLEKRLTEVNGLMQSLESGKADSTKTFSKVAGIFHDIEKDFSLSKKPKSASVPVPTAAVQEIANYLQQLNEAKQGLRPEIMDVQLSEKLAQLAGSAARISEELVKVSKTKRKP